MTILHSKLRLGTKGRRTPSQAAKAITHAAPVAAAARQLALAHWIDQRIEAGELRDLADAARVLGVTRARVTQIANLRYLPPAVQEAVLTPGFEGSERQLRAHAFGGTSDSSSPVSPAPTTDHAGPQGLGDVIPRPESVNP